MQVSQHVVVAGVGSMLLICEDMAGAAREPSKEQQQVVLEIEQRVHWKTKGPGIHRVVRVEGEARHATERGDVLILFADRLAEFPDLDLTCELCQLARMQQSTAMRIECLQECRGEAAGRAETRSGRNVRERRDFE